jgi:hypothetical protein
MARREAAELTFAPRVDSTYWEGRTYPPLMERIQDMLDRRKAASEHAEFETLHRDLSAVTFQPTISKHAASLTPAGKVHERLYGEADERAERLRKLEQQRAAELAKVSPTWEGGRG